LELFIVVYRIGIPAGLSEVRTQKFQKKKVVLVKFKDTGHRTNFASSGNSQLMIPGEE